MTFFGGILIGIVLALTTLVIMSMGEHDDDV